MRGPQQRVRDGLRRAARGILRYMRAAALLCCVGMSCTGDIRWPAAQSGVDPVDPTLPSGQPPLPERSTTRRLSKAEVARSVKLVFGPGAPVPVEQLPDEALTPFDNDVREQAMSMRLVEGIEAISVEVANWVVADDARLAALLPCVPTGPGDSACFRAAAQKWSRALWRQNADDGELNALGELLTHSTGQGTFAGAVKMLIRVLLMHPLFLFRTEAGRPGDPSALSEFEIATRMALLLQGHGPDEALLDAATAGELASPEGRAAQARRLLDTPEGGRQLERFVAMWLGYSHLSSGLEGKMRRESDALVARAFAEGQPFRSLFSSDDTFVDAELAAHYGLSAAGAAPSWVSYGGADRRGLLSHGAFAVAGAKFGDTSPTRRGKFIRERLLCQRIALPTVNVDVDQPPKSSDPNACKAARYVAHRTDPVCASCHSLTDPLGFGLERLDHLGRYRMHDEGRPECPISGEGELSAQTRFTGPKQLAALVAAEPRVAGCMAQFLLRQAAGRQEQPQDAEVALWLASRLEKHGVRQTLVAWVAADGFARRQEEP